MQSRSRPQHVIRGLGGAASAAHQALTKCGRIAETTNSGQKTDDNGNAAFFEPYCAFSLLDCNFDWRAWKTGLAPSHFAWQHPLCVKACSSGRGTPLTLTRNRPSTSSNCLDRVSSLCDFDVVVASLSGSGSLRRLSGPVSTLDVSERWHQLLSEIVCRRYGSEGPRFRNRGESPWEAFFSRLVFSIARKQDRSGRFR